MSAPCYCLLLRTATRRLGALYDEALEPFGINIAQYSLLSMISRRQPVSMTELGQVAELDRSTIGRNVRVLERMGLVKTGRGEDQREAVASLTPRGTKLLAEARPRWDECQRDIEAKLGADKLQALSEILHAV